MNKLEFPQDFLWGVATAAFQIEGASHEDGRSPSIWDTFCATPGKVRNGDTGEVACDHYHRWESDLDLIASLGLRAYRFSVAWPRIIPGGTGEVNEKGLDFYERLVDGMLERGIEPYCTLYHWDLPQVLEDKGGWTNREVVDAFVAYADAVTKRLGDKVTAYATFNEPWCSAFLGYENGEHAPGHQSRKMGLQAAHHILLAHGAALPIMRKNAPKATHGIVLNLNPAYALTDKPEDKAATQHFDGFFNRWYLEPLLKGSYPQDMWETYGEDVPETQEGDLKVMSAPIDFMGVNYYSRAAFGADPDAKVERTDMGWEVYPQGLTDLLVRLKRDYSNLPPIYITENGAAYPDELENGKVNDQNRISYLERHFEAVLEAIKQGVDVRGYFAWSLMDNFEWAWGYSKRFGIVHVDYETQERTPKASALFYRDFVKNQQAVSR